ncbi:hypothetical protein ERO13_D09G011700v2 [Gossypium hirsutum]|nr:hypothetical protein ERO13_D09G011700v2 [Gossypium hirsutum]
MKVRQLSDAIHDEVGNKVMGQISDSLWEIIRSEGSMRTKIIETVVSHRNNNESKLSERELLSATCNNPVPYSFLIIFSMLAFLRISKGLLIL